MIGQETISAITLWQPWASLIFAGRKRYETRHWRYPSKFEGQKIAIHAASKYPSSRLITDALHELCLDEFGCSYNHTLPLGGVLGTVRLVACLPTIAVDVGEDDRIAGNWQAGRFAWKLSEITPFPDSYFPTKGRQGWWRVTLPFLPQ